MAESEERKAATEHEEMKFTALPHHVTVDLFPRVPDAAPARPQLFRGMHLKSVFFSLKHKHRGVQQTTSQYE
jgi:hypothetical protein